MDLISIVFIFCTLQLLSFVCVCVFIYEDFRVDFGHVLLSGHVPVDKKEHTPKLSHVLALFLGAQIPKPTFYQCEFQHLRQKRRHKYSEILHRTALYRKIE